MATKEKNPPVGMARPLFETAIVNRVMESRLVMVSIIILCAMVFLAIIAPFIASDPMAMNPINRLKAPGTEHLFGTDRIGRDVFDRTVYGARVSLLVGVSVAVVAISVGLLIGLLAGFVPAMDNILMRVTDALMAIPSILLAIALMALFGSSVVNVIIAIAIAEIPGVVRLVRSVVLSQREQLFVEASVASGTRLPKLLRRHILPNTLGPLLVQGTLVFASAIITEAILSFLGAGTPPEVASWGNIVAEGRGVFSIAPWVIFFPGGCLALVVLAINILGDQMRDVLDPRLARQVA